MFGVCHARAMLGESDWIGVRSSLACSKFVELEYRMAIFLCYAPLISWVPCQGTRVLFRTAALCSASEWNESCQASWARMGSKMTSSRHFHSVGWKAIAGIGLFPRTHLKHSCVGCCYIAGCSAKRVNSRDELLSSAWMLPQCGWVGSGWGVKGRYLAGVIFAIWGLTEGS